MRLPAVAIVLVASPLFPLSAATLLIGGDTRNGNFTTLASGATDDGDVTFDETEDWTNVAPGGTQTIQALRNTPAGLDSTGAYAGASGGYNAVLTESDTRWFGNDTGYTVATGDLYDVSYHWIDAFNWDDASDQVALRFFTTANDLIDGTEEDFLILLSGVSTANATYEEFSQTGLSLPAAFDGDRLFVAFYGEDGNANANGFARVDDFSLSVTPVPEPGSALLAGLAAVALLRRRR